jgi:tRNA (cytidine56-2'-O)-methyltransferase
VGIDLCLTARALGASGITFVGKKDSSISRYLNSINGKWGGKFRVEFVKNYKDALKSALKYTKVYLTQFGAPLHSKKSLLRTYKNIVLIVTPKKERNNLHRIADFNVSVSTQPHCSTAAIAVFLHEFYEGRELAMHFENAKLKVVPKMRGVEIKSLK